MDTIDVAAVLDTINSLSAECSCELSQISAQHLAEDNYRLSFRATYGRGNTKARRTTFFQKLAANAATTSVQIVDEQAAVK